MTSFIQSFPDILMVPEEGQLRVILEPHQFDLNHLDQYQAVLDKNLYFFDGKLEEVSQESATVFYDLGESAKSLTEVLTGLTLLERLKLAQKVQFLAEFSDALVLPYIHPDNLFVLGDVVKVAHRGFAQTVVPYSGDKDGYFKAYRALILYIIDPKLKYLDLISGSVALKTPFSEDIQKSVSFESLNDHLTEQVVAQVTKDSQDNVAVPKRHYNIYKWGSMGLAVAVVVLAAFSIFTWVNTVPYKDRIITAEIYFTNNQYSKAIDTLKNDNPRSLPIGTKYALAVSAINQDTLNNEQKTNVLKNISLKSNENVLLYWIYLGFGDYDKTLDVAQNIGDTQLILYAYQKLYNKVSADSTMRGSEKQEKLKEYSEQIANYEKMLNGEDSNGSNG